MKTSMIWVALGAAGVMVGSVGLTVAGGGTGEQPFAVPTATFRIETDHATYESVADLKKDAEYILTGTVVSHVVDPGVSPGNDAYGDPLPAVPRTNYTVNITSSIKGGLPVGSTIVVSVVGGQSGGAEYVLDGGVKMTDGGSYMMVLVRGTDGSYYPLAGGSAIGTQGANGNYTLPDDVTNASTPLQLTSTGQDPNDPQGPSPSPPTQSPSPSSSPSTVVTVSKAAQTASFKTPKAIKRKGRTVLLKKPVVTSSGQVAKATVTWKPGGSKYAKVKRSKGALIIVTKGKRKLQVRLQLTAPETATSQPFTYSKVWTTKGK